MAISDMSHVTVIGHESRVDQVVAALQRLGTVEVTTFSDDVADGGSDLPARFNPTEQIAELDDLLAKLKFTIDTMGKHRRIKKSIVENFTGYRLWMTDDEWAEYTSACGEHVHSLHERARGIEDSIAENAARRTQIQASIEILEPWRELAMPLEQVKAGKYVMLTLGVADPKTFEAKLRAAAESVPGIAWELISAGTDRVRLLVAYPISDADEAVRALSEAGFSGVSLPQYSGVPAEELAKLEGELVKLASDRTWLEGDIDALVEERPRAFALFDYLSLERARLDVTQKFGGTARTFFAEGWVQTKHLDELRTTILGIADDLVMMDRPPREGEEPPVELSNPRWAAPFEVITKTMGYPKQGSLDPTPYLAPFFLIFFGLCMTDAVYGLVIAAAGYLLIRKTRARGGSKLFLDLIVAAGWATVVMGALLGGWAGDLLSRLFGWKTAILFDPMESPTSFLILSFALGVVHIFTGIGLKAYDNIRHGQWLSAIYDQVFWLVLLSSLGLMLVGGSLGPVGAQAAMIAKYTALASALGLVATQGRHQRNPLMRLGSGLLSLYGITGYASDVISYARLFGLGFTSTVLASVMNDLFLRPAGIPVIGPVIAAIGLVFGHMFNILINVIGAYVHSSRLQYIEFFGKFFEAGGRRFMPFGVHTKYIELENTKGV